MKELFFRDLQEKVCVITGGSGVLGSSIAMGLGSAGVKTVILSRRVETVESTARKIEKNTGTASIGISADVLDRSSLENAKAIINDKFGKIDLLINCAGGNSAKATASKEVMATMKGHFSLLMLMHLGMFLILTSREHCFLQ